MILTTILHITIILVSLYFLILGGEWVVKSSVYIAEKMGISKLAIASTIIAFGTSLPTIAVNLALVFIIKGDNNMIIGNALGTNYVNIGLALGIPAFMLTIVTKYSVFEKEIPIYLAISAICSSFALDGILEWYEGVILLVSYIFSIYITYQYSIREKINTSDHQEMNVNTSTVSEIDTSKLKVSSSLIILLIGLLVLIISSVSIAVFGPMLGNDLGISQYIIGLTVIGIGTSLPTVITSIRAAKNNYTDIILGNVFGGTIANMGIGLGLISIFSELKFDSEAISDIYYFSIFNIAVLFLILIEMKILGNNKSLSKVSGIIIVLVYCIYLASKLT